MNRIYTCILTIIAVMGLHTHAAAADAADNPQVAMDAGGNVVAIWQGLDNNGNHYIETARKTSGGNWTTPKILSPAGQTANYPVLTENAGNCLAVWFALDAVTGYTVIYASTCAVTGSWSTPQQISNSSHTATGICQIHIDNGLLNDPMIIIWSGYNNLGGLGIYSSTALFSLGVPNWTTPVKVGGS